MTQVNVNEAKANLSALLEAVQRGEEVIIARYGKPIARLTALEAPRTRELGFYPIQFTTDLLEPTPDDVIEAFYETR
jgi:prevent-host-death family protein